uniref:Structural maintenance of chromosomes protein 6 n=1 Tax=Cacopsylla melanoneura TaxID=428564 RepID=A0A8D8M381_9HEMI
MSNRRNISFDVPLSSSTPLKKLCTEKNSVLSQQSRGTAGVIKCINVKNFMCHDHFEMVFNPRINFISGRNGSGKSAIQTALIIETLAEELQSPVSFNSNSSHYWLGWRHSGD